MTKFIKLLPIRTRFLATSESIKAGILRDLYRGSNWSHFCLRCLEYTPLFILTVFEGKAPAYLLKYFEKQMPPEVIVLGDLTYSAKITFLYKKNKIVIKFGITKEAKRQIILEKIALRKLKHSNFPFGENIKLGSPNKIISPYIPMCKLSEICMYEILPLLSSLLKLPNQEASRNSDGNLLTYCHGDLAVWNVTKIDNYLVAFDWEFFGIDLAGLDLFYFCSSIFFLRNKSVSSADFFATYKELYNHAYQGEPLDEHLYLKFIVCIKKRSPPVYNWLTQRGLNSFK